MPDVGTSRPAPYQGPGLESAILVVPAVLVVATLSAVVTGWLTVGLAALIAGVVAWLVLWELFSRLHPRFSSGTGETLKWALVVAGPPVVAVAAAVTAN